MFHRKDKDQDIELNTQHVWLRAALFVLAVVVAVGAFAMGVSGIGHKEPGVYAVEASPDEQLPLYGGEMTLQYRFSGSSADIRAAMNELRPVYSAALKHSYILFDADNTYDGYINLATVNASLGSEVVLEPELFAALRDAWERTQRREGYNVFAGPLYAAWSEILYLEEPEPLDPLNDAETGRRIERLAAAINDLDNFRLTFDDARSAVRLEAAAPVLALLAEYELPQTILDLNILRDAYELRLVADKLEAQGYGDGCLTTASGLVLTLSRYTTGEYCLYGLLGEDVAPAAKASAEPDTSFSQVRIFPYAEEEYGFYAVEKDGGTILRHPYLTADGTHPDAVESSCVLAPGGDIVAARWENLRLNACADAAEAAALAKASGYAVAWTLPGETAIVHINAAGGETLHAAEDYGYRAAD